VRRPDSLYRVLRRGARIVFMGALLHLAAWLVLRRLAEREGLGWQAPLLIWSVVLYLLLNLFPQTRPLHNLLATGVLHPLAVALVVGLAAVILSRVLGRVLRLLYPAAPAEVEDRSERTRLRRATLVEVARVTGVTLIWFIAGMVGLSWAGVNLSALLASAGLIGVALGLAAQDWLKDVAAGVNILADDRFGVGDVIQVGEYTGTVENVDLRVTQLRDVHGRLITFSNRNIETVANFTSRWAQVDFKVGVAYETDLRRALSLLGETAETLREEWPERILAAPEVLGVDSFGDSSITLRMLLRTAPGDQWPVARELRLRVKEAFDAAGISIPLPQQVVRVSDGSWYWALGSRPEGSEPPPLERPAPSSRSPRGES
jgi:small conductance mechanosensitive channel